MIKWSGRTKNHWEPDSAVHTFSPSSPLRTTHSTAQSLPTYVASFTIISTLCCPGSLGSKDCPGMYPSCQGSYHWGNCLSKHLWTLLAPQQWWGFVPSSTLCMEILFSYCLVHAVTGLGVHLCNTLFCLENSVSLILSITSSSWSLSAFSFTMTPQPSLVRSDIHDLFRVKHLIVSYSLHIDQFNAFVLIPLLQEASPMRFVKCSALWE